jgi:hypothetical protein
MRQWGWTVLGAVGAVLLSGCGGGSGGSTFVTWEKPGVSEQQMRAEYGLCGGGFGSLGALRFRPDEFDAINRCMTRKGFRKVDL